MGRDYVIEHCVSLSKQKRRQEALQYYITDGIKAISETLAKQFGGSELNTRFYDIVKPPKVEKRTAQEIKDSILKKFNAMGGDEGVTV